MAISNGSTKVISPNKLAHVVLRTSPEKFEEMIAFYKTFLGAHTVIEVPGLHFLTYDDEHHRIAFVALPGQKPKDPSTSGLEHIAFTYDRLSDLLDSYVQRKELGVLPVWCVNHGPTLSIYYRDPDGNNLETQYDIFDTPEEATQSFLSPEYADNPFGVDFDPEDHIKKLKEGVDVKQLLVRPNIGKRDISTVPIV